MLYYDNSYPTFPQRNPTYPMVIAVLLYRSRVANRGVQVQSGRAGLDLLDDGGASFKMQEPDDWE